jgi:hypothetical protein
MRFALAAAAIYLPSRGKIRLERKKLELNQLLRQTAEEHRDLFARGGVELDVAIVDQPFI